MVTEYGMSDELGPQQLGHKNGEVFLGRDIGHQPNYSDEVAARIRAIAQESRVPLVANPPLARALYLVELDREVPAEHFQAVAEVIAYVWRLRGRVPRAAR